MPVAKIRTGFLSVHHVGSLQIFIDFLTFILKNLPRFNLYVFGLVEDGDCSVPEVGEDQEEEHGHGERGQHLHIRPLQQPGNYRTLLQ